MPDATSKIAAVARFEFLSTVKRPGYLVSLIGMPIFIGLIGALSGFLTSRMMASQLQKTLIIGILDETGLFADAPLEIAPDLDLAQLPPSLRKQANESIAGKSPLFSPTKLVRLKDLTELRAALSAGTVTRAARIPADWLTTGRIEELRLAKARLSLFSNAEPLAGRLRPWLLSGLLERKLDPAVFARVLRPAKTTTLSIEADGSLTPFDLLRELATFILPLGFVLLLLLSIFTCGGYLATGLAEEKQNRALELLLTALTPEELFWGKLLGLGGAGFLQFALYLAVIALPAALLFTVLGIEWGQLVMGLGYFAGGFIFFGALLLAAGSLGNTTRYTQQLVGGVTMTAMVPMLTLPVLLDQPMGTYARVLTLVPFSAPLAGMLRVGAHALPWWEFALSLSLLSAGAWLAVRLSSRVFRIALLSTGGLPSPRVLWSWLVG
ncbi:MAG: ABC transporter permease [Deltaproteobacteria bacterium]|nr:ABC transporter permease [Deltaproteobacteria bacterium]